VCRIVAFVRVAVMACSVMAYRPLAACNPEPPVPPILDGYEYDAAARDYLIRQSDTIALGRYRGKLEFISQGPAGVGGDQPDYVFELTEGWKSSLPARLVVPGHWIACDLRLKVGTSYLFYLDGNTPLFVIPAEDVLEDLEILGDLDWFYTPSGQLIRPDILPDVKQERDAADTSR
jgi:hypothetical protein